MGSALPTTNRNSTSTWSGTKYGADEQKDPAGRFRGGQKLGPVFVLFCSVVIAVGTALHFIGVDQKDCWFDEAATIGFSTEKALPWKAAGSKVISVITAAEGRAVLQELGNSPVRPLENVRKMFPDQGPGFPLVAWVVAKCFGNNIDAMRAMTGVFAVLISPLLYWLIIESTRDGKSAGDKRAALIGATLAAASPIVNVYAAEARPYTMLIVLVLASSIFLLRAQRTNRFSDWLAYSLLSACAVMTHVIVAAMIPAHCIFLLYKRVKLQTICLTVLPTISLLLMWGAFLGTDGLERASNLHGFANNPPPLDQYFWRILKNTSASFVDVLSLPVVIQDGWPGVMLGVPYFVSPLIFILFVVALASKRSATVNVVALSLLAPTLCLLAVDLLLSGQRGITVRYNLFVCVASIYTAAIAIEALWNRSFTTKLRGFSPTTASTSESSRGNWLTWRTVSVSIFVTLVLMGVVSEVAFARATRVWTKSYKQNELVQARKWLNQQKQPLLIVGSEPLAIAMLHRLRGDVNLEVVPGKEQYVRTHPIIIPPDTDAIVAFGCGKVIEKELRKKWRKENPRAILRIIE